MKNMKLNHISMTKSELIAEYEEFKKSKSYDRYDTIAKYCSDYCGYENLMNKAMYFQIKINNASGTVIQMEGDGMVIYIIMEAQDYLILSWICSRIDLKIIPYKSVIFLKIYQ